jgi:hypothetical protein
LGLLANTSQKLLAWPHGAFTVEHSVTGSGALLIFIRVLRPV